MTVSLLDDPVHLCGQSKERTREHAQTASHGWHHTAIANFCSWEKSFVQRGAPEQSPKREATFGSEQAPIEMGRCNAKISQLANLESWMTLLSLRIDNDLVQQDSVGG